MGYSTEEKSDIIRLFYTHGRNAAEARRQYHIAYPERPTPSVSTLRYTVRQFELRHSLERKKRVFPRDIDEDLTILLFFEGIQVSLFKNKIIFVIFIFIELPERSIPDAAIHFNKSLGKIHEILSFYKYRPYKFLPVQGLTEDNKQQRLEFCLDITRRLHADADILNKIIFTDEATFTTSGMYNRKNKHYWSTTNPHKIQEVKIQGRRSINVWCGLFANRIIGPVFFRGSLTGDRYLQLLNHEIEDLLETLPLHEYNGLIWQQDGAPAHNVMPVSNYLNNRYELWIGRRGHIHWPANSPDLAPCDIFLWGYLKNRVYNTRAQNIQDLEQRIRDEILILNTDHQNFIRDTITSKWQDNIHKCIRTRGGYIENQ